MNKSLMPRVEPTIGPFANVEQELNKLVATVNDKTLPAKPPRELTAAERISDDLTKMLISDAENCLLEAQNLLRDDQIFAEGIRDEVQRRAERHASFLERLHKLRADHENSRKEFQNSNGPEDRTEQQQ